MISWGVNSARRSYYYYDVKFFFKKLAIFYVWIPEKLPITHSTPTSQLFKTKTGCFKGMGKMGERKGIKILPEKGGGRDSGEFHIPRSHT